MEFKGDYLNLRQNQKWKKINNLTHDVSLVFADLVHKVNRADGKVPAFCFVTACNSNSDHMVIFGVIFFVKKRRKEY